MSENRSARLQAANDNAPQTHNRNRKVIAEWPETVPITCAELDLLELYLGDLILEVAANDN